MLMFLATGLAMASSAVEPQAARRDQLALDQMRHYAPYRAAVQGAYQKYEEALSGHCPSIDLDQATARARVELPLEVNEQGHIVNGIWTEQTQGVACGETRRYTALVIFKDSTPHVLPVFPGDSFASPALQHDALVSVASAMTVKGARCVPEVLDTVLPQGVPATAGAPWNETWTVRSCDQSYRVPIRFVPDATGTGFDIDPKTITQLKTSAG